MNENLHNIDDLFKNPIDGHSEEVPPEVWNNIDHSLDKKQAAFYKRKYFVFRAAAILLIFLVGGLTIAAILHFHQSPHSIPVTSSQENSTETSVEARDQELTRKPTLQETLKTRPTQDQSAEDQHLLTKSHETSAPRPGQKSGKQYRPGENNDSPAPSLATNDRNAKQGNHENFRAADLKGTPKRKEPFLPKPDWSFKTSPVDLSHQLNSIQKIAKEPGTETAMTNMKGSQGNFQRTTALGIVSWNMDVIDKKAMMASLHPGSSGITIAEAGSLLPMIKKTHKNSGGSWSISPSYAQNIHLKKLRDDDHFGDPRNNSHEARRLEQQTTSFTTGIGIQKQFGNHFLVQTGGYYFSSQTHIQPKTIFAQQDRQGEVRYQFRCSSGDSYISTKTGIAPALGDSIKTNFSRTTLSYFQLPLVVGYTFSLGKFSLTPAAGIETNFLLNGKLNSSLAHSSGEEAVAGSINGLKSRYLSGIFQPQLNYQFSDRISFDFNSNINFSLSPINKETAVKTYQNMIGLGAGIRIKL
ncbi:MAG: hypothetical protein ACXVBN_18240 [Flavisolibacter sp.]